MLDFIRNLLPDPEAQEAAPPEHDLKLATAALLIEISRADAEVSGDEEAAVLAACQRRFEITAEEASALVSEADSVADHAVSLQRLTRTLNESLGLRQRIHVVELLWEVAFADGRIDKYEDFFVRKIANLLHVPHADFVRAKLKASGELQ